MKTKTQAIVLALSLVGIIATSSGCNDEPRGQNHKPKSKKEVWKTKGKREVNTEIEKLR